MGWTLETIAMAAMFNAGEALVIAVLVGWIVELKAKRYRLHTRNVLRIRRSVAAKEVRRQIGYGTGRN